MKTGGNPQNLKRTAGPGRPKGLKNKVTRDMKEFAAKFLTSPAYVTSARKRVTAGKAPHLEILWHHYAYGKPKEQHEHSGEIRLPMKVIFELHPE